DQGGLSQAGAREPSGPGDRQGRAQGIRRRRHREAGRDQRRLRPNRQGAQPALGGHAVFAVPPPRRFCCDAALRFPLGRLVVSLQEASARVVTAPPEPLPAVRGMPPATVAGLLAVTFVWGINFAVVKVGLAFLPPIAFVALRFLAVGLILLPWMRLPRQRLGD